jgi:hypothetical protein
MLLNLIIVGVIMEAVGLILLVIWTHVTKYGWNFRKYNNEIYQKKIDPPFYYNDSGVVSPGKLSVRKNCFASKEEALKELNRQLDYHIHKQTNKVSKTEKEVLVYYNNVYISAVKSEIDQLIKSINCK